VIEGSSEMELLRAVVPELEAEGYQVFLQPSGSFLPAFLQEIRPDAIALSEKKNLAIEIARDTSQARQHLQQLSTQIKGQPKWELRVFWVSPTTSRTTLTVQPPGNLRERIEEAKKLLAEGHRGSALLIGWATFEAICRALMPQSFRFPQTPARLVEVISSEGYITPDEADRIRFLAQLRNGFIHGNLDIPMDAEEIAFFIELLSKLEMAAEQEPQLHS
jgi:uncharacterized protein YutE (UPF0331/DUF86 family)